MNIKAVAKNVGSKGIKETLRIRSRKKDPEFIKIKKELSQKNLKVKKQSGKINILNKKINKLNEKSEQLNEKIKQLNSDLQYVADNEDSSFKEELHAKYIKEIIPQIYEEYSKYPVENKVIFMERGRTKSPSLNYIYKKMINDGKYDIHLHELKVRAVPETLFYRNVVDFIKDAATAKAIFVCTANEFFGYINELRPETKYIQLWHGCGAFKKVGLSTIGKSFGKSEEKHKEYPQNTNYSYVTIASPEVSWIFEESMGIDKNSGIIVPVGISRTDEFFDEEYRKRCYKKLYDRIPEAKDKKVILYAPTFRGEVAKAVSPDVLDIKKFADAFKDEYVLIFKHHQSVRNTPPIPEEYENSFAYDMTRGKGMTINEIMTVSDICISDYSSLVFEYSLFERPMIFFTYDIDEYMDERGLYYDFNEITPGPMFNTNDEIIDYIKHIEERFDKQAVIDFKNKFMSACDGNSTERIINLIEG